MNQNKKYFTTTLLPLAAALQTVSLSKLMKVERYPNTNKAAFCFDSSLDPRFEQIVTEFFNKNLPIDAFTYFESLRFIKSWLYNEGQDAQQR